jgi:putative spermidine/putrescine transport system substrate-binding protein
MFTYNPDKVPNPPKTAADLLAWAKANPGKFLYARPANSGPGRAFLQGLPFILGDKNFRDPATWDKTWAYLKELDNYVDYYPSGTGITFKELAEGTRWIIASHLGWDMNQRILATIPPGYQAFFLRGTTWVNDSQFIVVPKGLDPAREKATIALMDWLMQPAQQAITYDNGYFYPGPAIKGVPLAMAPQANQDKIKAFVRTAYEEAIVKLPNTTQLDAKPLVAAFDMWDKLVGSKVKK